jgi:hypothetical protein
MHVFVCVCVNCVCVGLLCAVFAPFRAEQVHVCCAVCMLNVCCVDFGEEDEDAGCQVLYNNDPSSTLLLACRHAGMHAHTHTHTHVQAHPHAYMHSYMQTKTQV